MIYMWVIEFIGTDNKIHKKRFLSYEEADFFKVTHCGIYNMYYVEDMEDSYE